MLKKNLVLLVKQKRIQFSYLRKHRNKSIFLLNLETKSFAEEYKLFVEKKKREMEIIFSKFRIRFHFISVSSQL